MQPAASGRGRAALSSTCLPPAVRRHLRREARQGGCFVYDTEALRRRAARLRSALPPQVDVCYAVKANAHPAVMDTLVRGGVDGFDVASAGELALAARLRERHGSLRIVATGPAKTDAFLDSLLEHGADVVNVESVLELQRLSAIAVRRGVSVPVALRVNPERVPVRGSLVMGGAPTQFGIPEADIAAAIDLTRRLPALRLVGFHVHAVCQNLDAAAHASYVHWCVAWSRRTAQEHGVPLDVVDVGGGIGVPFDSGDAPFDVEKFGAEVEALDLPSATRLVVEPGRWLTTEAGWYAAPVVDLKHAYGETFVLLRGGINHFQLPISWDVVHNFAVLPVDPWPHAYPRPEVADVPVTVVGELCTTEDMLARDIRVDRLRVGDLVVFPDAGSYGWEFAMPSFLGQPPATRHLVSSET